MNNYGSTYGQYLLNDKLTGTFSAYGESSHQYLMYIYPDYDAVISNNLPGTEFQILEANTDGYGVTYTIGENPSNFSGTGNEGIVLNTQTYGLDDPVSFVLPSTNHRLAANTDYKVISQYPAASTGTPSTEYAEPKLTITNTGHQILPSTGGPGVYTITYTGITIALSSAFRSILYQRKRKAANPD